jgi:nucleoid-associated protein YgaU
MKDGFLKNLLKRIKLNESSISMVLGALVIIVIGALIFNYFKGVEEPEETPLEIQEVKEVKVMEKEGKLVPEGLPTTHQVSASEDLWKIAERYYGSGYNWVNIAQENDLTRPDFLIVGQELIIPEAEVIRPLAEAEASVTGDQYTVVKGDSLWGIALRAYQDGYRWVVIARENNLTNPDLIHPGNVLSLPR